MTHLLRVTALVIALLAACDQPPSAPRVPPGSTYSTSPSNVTTRRDRGDERDAGAHADAGSGTSGYDDTFEGDVGIVRNELFEGYLVDRDRRALYMFANDLAGSKRTTCLGDCSFEWPPFDVATLDVSSPLDPSDFARIHRDDGAWQVTFKGHPLYYYRGDSAGTVRGDGIDEHWFVARDYFAFVASRPRVAPDGSGTPAPSTPFLTDGAGRTLYVYGSDTPAIDADPPVASCTDECVRTWPLFARTVDLDHLIVPSSVDPSAFGVFTRHGDVHQLTFRGWPLYFYVNDDQPGEVSGHNVSSWRAIDPATFGDPSLAP